MILYFVGITRSDAGTDGARDISMKLCIISAKLEEGR